MKKLLFSVILCLLIVLLAGCSKPDKKTKKPPMQTAVLKAASMEVAAMLSNIRTCQVAYMAEKGAYLECYPSPPDGGTDAAPDVWVDAGGFEIINFSPDGAVRHQYSVTVSEDGKSYTITATGDLDENGIKAVHTLISGNTKPSKMPSNEY